MFKIESSGIYPNMASADYFADPCPRPSFTQSLAKIVLDQSANHARLEHPRLTPRTAEDEPEKYTAVQAIGSVAHRLLIGRGKEVEVIKFDSFKTKDAQKTRDEAAAAGKVPILERHYASAMAMVAAARVQLRAAHLDTAFDQGQGEVCIAWEEDGLWFRSLIDWMETPRILNDYKTGGGSFAPDGIGLKAEGDGWDIQAAMQERGLNAIDPKGTGRRTFRFICQENYEPYALVAIELNEHWLTMGRKKLDMAIGIWRRAMETGIWPSYPSAVLTPQYPGYREAKWLEREVADHERRPIRETIPSDHFMAG